MIHNLDAGTAFAIYIIAVDESGVFPELHIPNQLTHDLVEFTIVVYHQHSLFMNQINSLLEIMILGTYDHRDSKNWFQR